jgi:AraC family transcriptional regulator
MRALGGLGYAGTVLKRASWNGLDAALIDTPAGTTHAAASTSHRLGIHVGRAVRASCRFGGRTHARVQRRGDIDLVPAGAPGVWEDDRSTRILAIRISNALIRTTAGELGLDPDRVELVPQFQLRDARLEHIASAFEAELESSMPDASLYGESLAVALAAHLIHHYRTSASIVPHEPTHGLAPRQLKRVADYIESHLDRALTLTELAAVAGVSTSHFKALFKRSVGMPAHQYVVRRRVDAAKLLLLRGSTIADAASSTGFADQSHLARWMRRVLGVTPAMLRRDRES